jgi:hypothetical protein
MASTAYPLTLNFDQRSSDHRFTITNAQGQTVIDGQEFLIKSKLEVAAYQKRRQSHYVIKPKSGFQWLNPPFHIWNDRERPIGAIHRQHWWNNCYQIDDAQQHLAFSIQAENAARAWAGWGFVLLFFVGCLFNIRDMSPNTVILRWVFVGVSFLGLSLIASGHLCNVPYWVKRANGRRVMQFAKNPSHSGQRSSFTIRAIDTVSESEELAILCGIILTTLRHGEKQSND